MASASAIKAGEAFVRIFLDKDDVDKGLKQLQANLNRFARTAQQVGLSLTAIGGAALFGLSRAVKAANEVELTGRRLDAVFRDGADAAREFARTLATEIGASRFEIEKALTTFKSFFAEIVDSEEQQTAFARRLTTLSRDFAAFQGLTPEDSLQRFISALSGSPEVLDRFGINLKAAAIDANLAERGIDGTTESVSEFQKVISRLEIIERTLGEQGAIGKAREELNKFNGRLTQAKAAVLDFLVAVGRPLLTALKPVLIAFTALVTSLTFLADTFPFLTVAISAAAVSIGALGVTLVALSVGARAASFSMGLLSKAAISAGISLAAPISSIRSIVQVSKILNESILTTTATMVLGGKRVAILGSIVSKLAPIFSRVASVIKLIASPIALVVAGVGAVLGILVLLARRLTQIFGPLGPLFEKIGATFSAFARGAIDLATRAAGAVRAFVREFLGLGPAIDFVAKLFSGYFSLLKEGFDEVREVFSDITDFLGLTNKTKVEIAAEQSAGPSLTPEEIAAQEEDIARRRKEVVERIEDLQIASIRDTTARAIAEIEKRYEREVELAEDSAEVIAALQQAKEQELANLRLKLVEQYYRRLETLDNQIARERASGINNEFERRKREAEISRDIALRAENVTQSEREKIAELFAARIANIDKDRAESVAEFELQLQNEILQAQSSGIESRLLLELDAIKRKYDEERKEAERLGSDLEAVDAARRAREEQAFREDQQRRAEAIAELEQRRADAEEDVQRQIDRLDIDLGAGTEFEKALKRLELDRVEALVDSEADADSINELFDKRERLLRQQDAADRLDSQQGRAFGAFNAQQIAAFGTAAEPLSRQEQIAQDQLEEQRKTNRELRELNQKQGAAA